MIGGAISAVAGVAGKVVGIFTAKQERKKLKQIAEGKLALAKQTGSHQITLSDQEWETVAAKSMNESWKDEYVTIVITSPIVLIILGALYFVFTGDTRLLDSANLALDKLTSLGLDMGKLMYIVVLAAVGLKAWRMTR